MESKYEIIIFWSEEDDAYLAAVPELSGCMADGQTYREALEKAKVLIREWIETAKELGRPIGGECLEGLASRRSRNVCACRFHSTCP